MKRSIYTISARLTVTVSDGVSSTRLKIINTSPALVSKWCWECSSWIQSLNKLITARHNSIPNRLPILINALKLVLSGDYVGGIIANGQSGIGAHRIALKFNYHRNIGGCVYSSPWCVTHYHEVPDSHRDAPSSISLRDYGSGNESIGGKLGSISKIVDGDEWTWLGLCTLKAGQF